MSATDGPSDAPLSPHARDRRPSCWTAGRPPAPPPSRPTDGRSPSSSSTIELDAQPHRVARVARRARRRPGADHRRARATASRRGRPTAASSRSRPAAARRTPTPRCTCCRSAGPGEVRTVATMPEGIADLALVARRRVAGVHEPRPATPATTPRTSGAQPPRKIETFFTRLDNVGWIVDRPSHVYVVARRRHRRRRATSRRGRSSTTASAWLADSSGVVTSAPPPRRVGPRPRRGPLRRPAGRRDRRPHEADRLLRPAVGLARRLDGRVHRLRRPAERPAEPKVGVIPVTGGAHRWVSDGLDRTFAMTAGRAPPVWLDDDTLLATAEDRGETHLYRLGVAATATPERADQRRRCASPGSTPPAGASPRPRPPSSTRPRSSRSTGPSPT